MRLNKNPVFKFLSSVRLAVPLMIVIIVTVAAGTIFESLYNAAYANLAVYGTTWFFGLMVVLWLNIFCAALSRWPWKKHHIGFVVTHLGMLTLLVGGFMTSSMGIDGSLQIPEGQENATVVLPGLSLGYQLEGSPTPQTVRFKRTLGEQSGSDLSSINSALGHVMTVEKFIPFAQVEQSYAGSGDAQGPVSLSFILKSQFFNVNEWLHSADRPEMQMGPARIRLVEGRYERPSPRGPARTLAKPPVKTGAQSFLVVLDKESGKELKKLNVDGLRKGATVNGVTLKLIHSFRFAVVTNNKIGENDEPNANPNPALEIALSKSGEDQRDVVYAKYPEFSLNKKGNFGLSFRYETSGTDAYSSDSAAIGGAGPGPGGNVVEFHFDRANKESVQVVLLKNGEYVTEKLMKEGDAFTTPWMGMTVFLGSVIYGSQAVTKVTPIKPEKGGDLPPGAVFVKTAGNEQGFWLALGEVKPVQISGRPAMVAFQNETLELPFRLKLQKFSKVDYPGTQTAMSYESLVELSRNQSLHTISMNEPLKEAGYTLYQASYQLTPGQPPVTVLSVNRDPGRPVKYAGGIILSIGIITFTLMRSRVYRAPRA